VELLHCFARLRYELLEQYCILSRDVLSNDSAIINSLRFFVTDINVKAEGTGAIFQRRELLCRLKKYVHVIL